MDTSANMLPLSVGFEVKFLSFECLKSVEGGVPLSYKLPIKKLFLTFRKGGFGGLEPFCFV